MSLEVAIAELKKGVIDDVNRLNEKHLQNPVPALECLYIKGDTENVSGNVIQGAGVSKEAENHFRATRKQKEGGSPSASYPFKRSHLNKISTHPVCPVDIQEQRKEKLRQVFLQGDVWNSFRKVNTNEKNKMVRYGEYSPRNPSMISPDKPLLALGEYEERRRQLLEQKKREYRQQMAEARISMNTPRRKEYNSQTERENSVLPYTEKSEVESRSLSSHAASTQTDIVPEKFIPEKDATLAKVGVATDASDSIVRSIENDGVGSSFMVPLTLTVPDEVTSRSPKYQNLSPRERKLAELRGSNGYSPSFYEGHVQRGSPPELGQGILPSVQSVDPYDDRMRRQAYQEELRQQIEEKRRLEALEKERERREEEAIMRRVEQQQEQMRLEYEQEKAQREKRQAQKLHLAEQFQRRQEELKLEIQQEREELRKKKKMFVDGNQHETDRNDPYIKHNNLTNSYPVPAIRIKLISDANNSYQSPKEITEILNNFPVSETHIEDDVSIMHDNLLQERVNDISGTTFPLHEHSTHPTQFSDSSRSIMLPDNLKYSTTNTQNTYIDSDVPTAKKRSSSPVVPAVRTLAELEQQAISSNSVYYNEYADQPELKHEVTVPKNILRTTDVLSEARPTNILTQLGAFRRQMQIGQKKMEAELQMSLQKN